MARTMTARRRLRLAWHRHLAKHWAWAAEVAMYRNDPEGFGVALAAYNRETRIVDDLCLYP